MNSYNVNINFKGVKTFIPVIDVGKFNDGFVTLIGQLHGDEYASRLICYKIIKQTKILKRGLRIITCANYSGAKTQYKFDPVTNHNLNRRFRKQYLVEPDNISDLIAKKIIELCVGSDFVIDFHDMPGSEIPICSIITLTKNEKANKKNYRLVQEFNPDISWCEDFRNRNIQKRYLGTINSYLNNANIPNFTIETSPTNKITEKTTLTIVRKVIQIVNKSRKPRMISLVERDEVYSPIDGILIPTNKRLLSKVKSGEILCKILNEKLEIKNILSPITGILIRKSIQMLVNKNQKIFDIGKEVLWKD